MNRAQRRAAAKDKNSTEVSDKIALFEKMPDECLTCLKPYDKNDLECCCTRGRRGCEAILSRMLGQG